MSQKSVQTVEPSSTDPRDSLLPTTLIPEYPGAPLRIPIANGVTFSTGNLAQALLLQYIYPNLGIRTPFTARVFIDLWNRHARIRELATDLRNHLYYSEAVHEPIQSIMSEVYQYITSKQTPNTTTQEADPAATAIGEQLITIYFESLNISLNDVKHVIFESGIALDTINDAFIDRIMQTRIKKAEHKNPVALVTLLPDCNIIKLAVEQCRSETSWGNYWLGALKNVWHQIIARFVSLFRQPAVNYFSSHMIRIQEIPTNTRSTASNAAVSSPQPGPVPTISYMAPFAPPPTLARPPAHKPLTTFARVNDDDFEPDNLPTPTPAPTPGQTNYSLSQVATYKEAVIRTLEQYISWYKFGIFGHHHDERARAVRTAIQRSTSIENIYTILKRQEIILSDVRERQATMTSQELQKFARIPENLTWRNPYDKLRWNGFFDVVNYTPPANSGYYQIIQEALAIDPFDASLPIRYGLT